MILSAVGKIAKSCWIKIPDHFANVELDEYVIMPNHVHGIIFIKKDETEENNKERTPHVVFLQKTNQFSRHQSGSISVIIQQFKSSVKRWCNRNEYNYFSWQSRFYDHVIRNEKSLRSIREYIINNPLKWELDKNNPENLYM